MRIGQTIYLDHQATTPLDQRVFAEMAPYHVDLFGNPHSSDHILGWQASRAIENSATELARLIGADSDEIFFTSGATESNNMALLGLGRKVGGSCRRRILVSAIEHKCVLASARVLEEQYEFSVEWIPVNQHGFIELAALDDMIGEDVLVMSVMAVNNEVGTIQDIEKISELACQHGVIFHCDAAQAPLGMPVSNLAKYADILSLSGHKMYGPKGVGIAYICRALQDQVEPLIYGGGQQCGLRSGTIPVPLCVGMGAAAKILCSEDAHVNLGKLRQKRDIFEHHLTSLRWNIGSIGPDSEYRHPGNASICFHGFSAHEILGTLQPRIAASTGSACTSGIPEPSHVLHALGLNGDDADATVRFSLGFGTTDEDVDNAVTIIEQVLEDLSSAGLEQKA